MIVDLRSSKKHKQFSKNITVDSNDALNHTIFYDSVTTFIESWDAGIDTQKPTGLMPSSQAT